MRKLITGILLILSTLTLYPQEPVPVYDQSFNGSFEFVNKSHPSASQKIFNQFISRFSEANNKRKSEIQINIDYALDLKVYPERRDNYYRAVFTFKILDVKGDKWYKDFNMEEYLYPKALSFDFVLRDQHLKSITQQYFKEFDLGNKREIDIKHTFGYLGNIGKFYAELSELEFTYTPDNAKEFNAYINLIHQYYAADLVLDELINEYGLQDVVQLSVEKHIALLFECRRILILLETFNLAGLDLNIADPKDLLNRIQNLDRIETRFTTLLAKRTEDIQNMNTDSLALDLIGFQNAYLINNFSIPHEYVNAMKAFGKAYYRPSMFTGIPQTHIEDLRRSLELITELSVKECFEEEDYFRALVILENIGRFNEIVFDTLNTRKIQLLESQTYYGLYNSYLSIAGSAIDQMNLDMALRYIAKADEFQQQHQKSIISNEKIINVKQELINKMIAKAAYMNKSRQYYDANDILEAAYAMCEQSQTLNCNEVLFKELAIARQGVYNQLTRIAELYYNDGKREEANGLIRQANAFKQDHEGYFTDQTEMVIDKKESYPLYQKLIINGKAAFEKGNYLDALDRFEEAKSLESFGYAEKDELGQFLTKSAKQAVMLLLGESGIKIWENDLITARQYYHRAISLQQKYELRDVNEINQLANQLSSKIYNNECDDVFDKYETYLLKTARSMNQQDYLNAELYLKEAGLLIEKYAFCNIQDTLIDLVLNRNQAAIAYQKKWSQLNDKLFEQGFRACIEDYIALEQYYRDQNISRFGIEQTTFLDILTMQENAELMKAGLDYYMKKKQYSEAYQVMDLLYDIKHSVSDIRIQQEGLAIEMARMDYSADDQADPEALLARYNADDPWYRHFHKAYLEKWSELKKERSKSL